MSSLTHLAAIMEDLTPIGVESLNVSRSANGKPFYSVTMHWRQIDGLRSCAIGDGPTFAAAYNAANLNRLLLVADAKRSVALIAEREGVN